MDQSSVHGSSHPIRHAATADTEAQCAQARIRNASSTVGAASWRAQPMGQPPDGVFRSSVSIPDRARTSYAASSGRVPLILQQKARAQHRPTSIAGAPANASILADPPRAMPATVAPEGTRPTTAPHLQHPGDEISRQRTIPGVAMLHSAKWHPHRKPTDRFASQLAHTAVVARSHPAWQP